nr:NAD(P)-binding domain-containing protein [Chloroflexota bacterium]
MSVPDAPYLLALSCHARDVALEERAALERCLEAELPQEGAVVVRTCHRVDVYLVPGMLGEAALACLPSRTRRFEDEAVVRHAIATATGLDSTVLAEDQILHQLRQSLAEARARGPLPTVVERLFQVALRAGRRSRTWGGGVSRSLADVALDRVCPRPAPLAGQSMLIVGSGEMGRLLAVAARRRGASVTVASRDPDHAALLASSVGADVAPLDPGPAVTAFTGVLVALRGEWPAGTETRHALREANAIVVDLSAPSATPVDIQAALGERFVSVDALADTPSGAVDRRLRERLNRQVDEATVEFLAWLRSRTAADAIQALTERAERERRAELDHLWRVLPALDEPQRVAIEGMSRH